MSYLSEWRKKNRRQKKLLDSVFASDSEEDIERTDHFSRQREVDNTSNFDDNINLGDDNDSDTVENEHGNVHGIFQDSEEEIPILESDEEMPIDIRFSEQTAPPTFCQNLASWASKNRCTRSSINELLSLLKVNGHDELPKDSRTLLSTPRSTITQSKAGGDYYYFGIGKSIEKLFETSGILKGNELNLVVNIDGLPLFKSSGKSLWPILVCIENYHPFVVALFCGSNKPYPVEEYLDDFIEEFKQLQSSGLEIGGRVFKVSINCFSCDAPARQMLRCINAHSGFYACERCIVKGKKIDKRMVFENIDCDSRTDAEFDAGLYEDHQLSNSVLCRIVGCVSQFVIEPMHLIYLGVTRRLLFFLRGDLSKHARLSLNQINLISEKLDGLARTIPRDFARQPRGLKELNRWKATEFKLFMLYLGTLVLKDYLSSEQYEHFLALSIATRILSDSNKEERERLLNYASNLLRWFVYKSKEYYGRIFITYNVHSLIHIHEDVLYHNHDLQRMSAFVFENFMQSLKQKIKTGKNPLVQVINRVFEDNRSSARTYYCDILNSNVEMLLQ